LVREVHGVRKAVGTPRVRVAIKLCFAEVHGALLLEVSSTLLLGLERGSEIQRPIAGKAGLFDRV
jgi:hypothetical protein